MRYEETRASVERRKLESARGSVRAAFGRMPYGATMTVDDAKRGIEKATSFKELADATVATLDALAAVLKDVAEQNNADEAELREYRATARGIRRLLRLDRG